MRHLYDYYTTPQYIANYAVGSCFAINPMATSILEPGCGDNYPFLKASFYNKRLSYLDGVDIRDLADKCDSTRCTFYFKNFLDSDYLGNGKYDVIATNPPYSLALEFIEKCLDHYLSGTGVAVFLLRLGFLASQKRVSFFEKYPLREVRILAKRPSYTNDGKTDSSDYGLFFWDGAANRGESPTTLCHWDNRITE